MSVFIRSYVLLGVEAVPVTVEVDLLRRLPSVVVVGLPVHQGRESGDRVRSAITAAGFEFPRSRIVVSIAPADLRKDPAALDLPIAIGILAAAGLIPEPDKDVAFVGELSLAGELRPIRGSSAYGRAAARDNVRLVLPSACATMAAACSVHLTGGSVLPLGIRTLGDWVTGEFFTAPAVPTVPTLSSLDYKDCRGNLHVVDAFVEAAATGRPLVIEGAPGCGKTMLAARFGGILPPLTRAEQVETTTIHDVAGLHSPDAGLITPRPFRAPHHTVSVAGLLGGAALRPGETSLAHNGVLFLDEFPEFPRTAIEALRGPVEDRKIVLARSGGRVTLPTNFRLVVATNPCPCGWEGYPGRMCVCGESAERYLSKLDTPILKGAIRARLHVVPPSDTDRWPSTADLQARVAARVKELSRGE